MKQKTRNKYKKSYPFSFKLFITMITLSVLQLAVFIGTLKFSGELSYIKEYAYGVLSEKTQNRKTYIENLLTSKTNIVLETQKSVTQKAERIAADENMSVDYIASDKELNKKILRSTIDDIITLLRRSMVNDAFIILDSGNLYSNSDSPGKAGIYIRDMDASTSSFSNNEDLLMEAGSSDIAGEYGITLDYEWTSWINMGNSQDENFDFFNVPLKTATDNPGLSIEDSGYWSSFSGISPNSQKSIKYSLPLVSSDGQVYGVIGIGLIETTLLKNMPSFTQYTSYILGADLNNSSQYSVMLYSGSGFSRLVNDKTIIGRQNPVSEDFYCFNSEKDSTETIGSIEELKLYNNNSPYINQSWAIISVADKEKILAIYTTLINMFFISTLISIAFSILGALFLNRRLTSPLTGIIKTLDVSKNNNDIINFQRSGINEIDRLSDAITELQINVKEQSSQVSKIISMADMGIGVLMYNLSSDSVFIGESLIKLLDFSSVPPEDTTIPFDLFRLYLSRIDSQNLVCGNSIFNPHLMNAPETASIDIQYTDHETSITRWFNFNLTRNSKSVMGLVQDITKLVIEKKKIEYERDYDVTTGLLNRRAYYQKIDQLFSTPEKLKISAFIMMDLDNLKYVNDTYGHDFGDEYIKTAANVFKRFREYGGVVSRLSGDEFNIFLYGFESKDEIRKIISEIFSRLSDSYCILADGSHYKIRASGGIAWYPDDSRSYETLLKYADFAMYSIKHSIKGKISEFDFNAYSRDSILITGVEEMNRIIDEHCIKYAFQSIISAKTGEIFGFEALMRPQSDIINNPLEFIRIAHTSAKLYEIERLTWKLSLKYFRIQSEKGNIPPNAKIFVNSLSNCSMNNEDIKIFENDNKNFLDRIVLEILESEKSNDDYVKAKRKRIAKWNAMIALDDFGSGYNSEYSLITLKPDIIKIDRSIISGCDSDISRESIIRNLVHIASANNILVLAEGVETYNEMETVIKCGADLLQGYYLSHPVFEPEPLNEEIVAQIKNINAEN